MWGPELQAALSSQPLKVYFDTAPANAPFPYCIVQGVGGVPIQFLEGLLPEQECLRLQIYTWGKSRAASWTAASTIESLVAANMVSYPAAQKSTTYDSTIDAYGTQFDVYVWTNRN